MLFTVGNSRNLNTILLIIVVSFLISSCSTKQVRSDYNLCPKIILHTKDLFSLTDVESKLICGDPDSEAYKNIPAYQAQLFLTGYFQNRGYSNPKYEYIRDELHVYPNTKNTIKSITLYDNTKEVEIALRDDLERKYVDETLTPQVLNRIEVDTLGKLRDSSFACVKVNSTVDPVTGVVDVNVFNLDQYKFGDVEKEKIAELNEAAFVRFYPFRSAENFKDYKLDLAEKRFLRSGIVQGTYFQESCDNKKKNFSLMQNFVIGPSRTIRFGVGASTEVGPMVRLKWSNQRYGEMGSLLSASLQASFKNQTLSLLSNQYLWTNHPRLSLRSSLDVERDDQENYEETSLKLRPHLEFTHDSNRRLWTWSGGPSFILGNYKTDDNSEPERNVSTGAIEGYLNIKSHEYELYDMHPESGDNTSLSFDFRHPSMGFIDPLLRIDFSTLKLKKIGELGKGDAIFGIKLLASSTWVPNSVKIDSLPPSVKLYAGGSDDIRGFKLNSLPSNDGLGALTKLGLKLEIRKTYVFKPTIESFTFVDGAFLGEKSYKVDNRFWYSPGTGLRWLSPIGIVQGYVARQLSNKGQKDVGNFFYLGLGGVF